MIDQELLERAAAERRKEIATRADRPRDRRSAEAPGSRATARAKAKIEIRSSSDGTTVDFNGCASLYEFGYEMWDYWGPYTEIVSAGAGAQSLANPDLDVPLVLQHESLRRIARTTNGSLELSEGDAGDGYQGLLCAAPGLSLDDYDVAYIVPKMRAGLIDEMSFAFTITAGQWDPTYTEYRINAYEINRGDVSIVGYGANPGTTAELRALAGKLKSGRALERGDVDLLTRALGFFTDLDDLSVTADQLTALNAEQLRSLERALRRELSTRRMTPAMSLQDLLAVE